MGNVDSMKREDWKGGALWLALVGAGNIGLGLTSYFAELAMLGSIAAGLILLGVAYLVYRYATQGGDGG